MTDQQFVAVAGAIGPDDLHIPAQPAELQQALEHINDLTDQLDSLRGSLDKAAGDEDVHGETAFALQRVVRFSRFTAHRDVGMLKELAEVVQQEIKCCTTSRATSSSGCAAVGSRHGTTS